MPIYLDVSAAVHRRAGLGRYAESLARSLIAREPDQVALFYNREHGIEPLAGLEHVPARTVALGYKPWRMLVWLGQLTRIGFDRLLPDATLFHATEHLLLPLHHVPTLLTVHDLIFRHLPEHHKPLNRWYLNLTMPLYCRRADAIIAVSEQTRQDLITAYSLPSEKIQVVYEAADPRFHPQPETEVARVRQKYSLPDRYLLFVGTIEPRKNLVRLLEAFTVVKGEGLIEALVIVGKRGWLYDRFLACLEQSPVRQAVLFPGYVLDDDLPAIYAGAQLFAFPSLYEGFGLPVLEAMACGIPVVASDRSSIPEIGGTAALYVDPTDTDGLAAALRRVLRDVDLQDQMRRQGLQQAARFSWHRVAEQTSALYQAVLQASQRDG
ncbi:MAG TPA: glycosyltransferase family 1 protein [Anaerolineae bacterium]|nr:glycosyltransferase family 1 protein [Anaerolineae bacterium]